MNTILNRREGFTLIELTIVLVILGLLAAGVIGASKLISAAKAFGISAEINQHLSAVGTYYVAYNAYPGDDSSAIAHLSTTSANALNGNGDAKIRFGQGGITGNSPTSNEAAEAWNHLSVAKIVNAGTFTPAATGAKISSTNAVGSKLDGALYSYNYEYISGIDGTASAPTSGVTNAYNTLRFGGDNAAGTYAGLTNGNGVTVGLNTETIVPGDVAYAVDKKLDGVASATAGNILAQYGANGAAIATPSSIAIVTTTATLVPLAVSGSSTANTSTYDTSGAAFFSLVIKIPV